MKSVDLNQSKDTGLVLVLVMLVVAFTGTGSLLVLSSAGILLTVILVPEMFKPMAVLWFGLAEVLSRFFSSILLTFLYLVVVLPVAMVRRMFGADSMQLKKYGRGDSAFIVRDHGFTKNDLKNPY